MAYSLKLESISLINSFINIEILMKEVSNPSQAEAIFDFKEYFIKDLFLPNLDGISKKSSLINVDLEYILVNKDSWLEHGAFGDVIPIETSGYSSQPC